MAAPKSTPKDAQVMQAILKDMGVTEHEPRVINQMLEFTYRYVTDVLDDAKVYSQHANKKNVDTEDVKLAIQCRMDQSYTTPPPKDILVEVARLKNSQPLPLIKPYTGPKLPPDRYCLSSANYRLKSLKKPRIQLGMPVGGSSLSSPMVASPRINVQSQLAAKVTPSISVTGGQLSLVTKGVSSPTVTIVTRPSAMTTSSAPKPTFRLTSGIASTTASNTPISVISAAGNAGLTLKRKREDEDYDKP